MSDDLAGGEYWQEVWQEDEQLPAVPNPRDPSIHNTVVRAFDTLFRAHLPEEPGRLLEVGCARSTWLPYFAKEFGYAVTGLDYAPTGTRQAEMILAREGVVGDIITADLFDPDESLFGQFDVVVSFGLVEHFAETRKVISSLGRFVRPGGVLLTTVPNMAGMVGWVQALVNRAVYKLHVPLTSQQLGVAHDRDMFAEPQTGYMVDMNLGVCNLNGLDERTKSFRFKQSGLESLVNWNNRLWRLEQKAGVSIPSNRITSPYIFSVARRLP